MQKTQTLSNVFVSVFSIAITFMVIEVALRIVIPKDIVSSQPLLISQSTYNLNFFDLNPNTSGTIYGKNFRINSSGFRGEEFDQKAPIKNNRIAVMGDSIAFGYGVSDDETFPYLLEKVLRKDKHNDEVLNFGVWGYNYKNYFPTLSKKIFLFKPNVLLWQLSMNDVISEDDIPRGQSLLDILFYHFRNGFIRLRNHSLLIQWVNPMIRMILYNVLTKIDPHQKIIIGENLRDLDYYRTNGSGWVQGKQEILKVREFCKANNIELMIVIFPITLKLDEHYPYVDYHDVVKKFCSQNQINFVDLYTALKGKDLSKHRINWIDHHPDGEVYQWTAQAIFEHLKQISRENPTEKLTYANAL